MSAATATPLMPVATRRKLDSLAVSIPVMVWLDGKEPESGVGAKVCLVARNAVRLRLGQPFPSGACLRLKLPLRTRSVTGEVKAIFKATDGGTEVAVHSDTIADYLGILFPPETAAAPEPPKVIDPPVQPAPAPISKPVARPAVTAVGPPFAKHVLVIVQGRTIQKRAFSQTVRATASSSGTFEILLAQELEPEAPVSLATVAPDRPREDWICRITQRSSRPNESGQWSYTLSI